MAVENGLLAEIVSRAMKLLEIMFSEVASTKTPLQEEHLTVNLYRANGRGGFGSQTAADPLATPEKPPEKQTACSVRASHKLLTLQALSSSLNAGTGKRGVPQNGRIHLHIR